MKRFFVIISIVVFAALSAQGQSELDLATGIGLSGPMISSTYQWRPKISYGASVSYLKANLAINTVLSGMPITVQGFTNFFQAGLFAKYHPFAEYDSYGYGEKSFFIVKNSFYLKSGIFFRNNPEYVVSSTFAEPLTVGDLTLTPEQTGKVDVYIITPKIVPYAALGYAFSTPIKKLKIGMEAGIFYLGKPTVLMESTGTLKYNSRNQEQLQKNLSFLTMLPQLQFDLIYKLK